MTIIGKLWQCILLAVQRTASNDVVTVLTGGAERVSKNPNVSYEQRQAVSVFVNSLNRMTDRNDYDD